MSLISFGVGEAVGGIAQGAGNAALGAGMGIQGAGQAISGIAQGAGTAFSKLAEVLTSPMNILCDFAGSPLKRAEHERLEKAKNAEHERLMTLKRTEHELLEQAKDKDVQRDVERKIGVEKALANLQIEIAQSDAEIEKIKSKQKMVEMEFSTDMQIKRETEVIRIANEIDQLRKDKDFERMNLVSDSIMKYQREFLRINNEAGEAIGLMSIELRNKALALIEEKTVVYEGIQEKAIQQAESTFQRIDNNSTMSESSKNVLKNAVEKKLVGTIDNATKFIDQINDDLQQIVKDISSITSKRQEVMDGYLGQFKLINFSGDTTALLENSSERLVGFEK